MKMKIMCDDDTMDNFVNIESDYYRIVCQKICYINNIFCCHNKCNRNENKTPPPILDLNNHTDRLILNILNELDMDNIYLKKFRIFKNIHNRVFEPYDKNIDSEYIKNVINTFKYENIKKFIGVFDY